jgi:alpha-tubulin suppressor-like RCC1 family protein
MKQVFLLVIAAVSLHGQDSTLYGLVDTLNHHVQSLRPNASSALPVDVRYEIVIMSSGLSYTLKLDKYTGRVWATGKNADGLSVWYKMMVQNATDVINPSRVRFQIVQSTHNGTAYLIDSESGRSWVLTKFKDAIAWASMPEAE